MPYEFKTRRMVEFVETDTAGIMHFSNYFRYMEMTESAFVRELGHAIYFLDLDHWRGMPRVQANCDYYHPLRFGDEVEIHLIVREKRDKAITYEFIFHKLNAPTVQNVAKGRLTVVNVVYDPASRKLKAAPLPPEFSRHIEVAPADPV